MRNWILTVFGFATFLLCAPVPAQDAKFDDAIHQILNLIANSGADVAVSFRTLDARSEWSFSPDVSFHAASTMKIPVMIELFHQAKEGKLRLSDSLTIRNSFHSIVDNSVYELDAADDSETDLYKAEGQKRTLRELCELMITASSNLAANLLIDKLGVENIRATVHSLGAEGMVVLRGVEDPQAFDKGLNNTTTARALQQLLTGIANGKAVDSDSSLSMVEILERQQFNEGIPAGLPAGIRVAHKTGEIAGIHHDAAIVFAPRPYVLVVLVHGIADPKVSAQLIEGISRAIYAAVEPAPASPKTATAVPLAPLRSLLL